MLGTCRLLGMTGLLARALLPLLLELEVCKVLLTGWGFNFPASADSRQLGLRRFRELPPPRVDW